MYNIAVIGRSLNSESFEIVFDMLRDGEEAGKLKYQKYNWDIAKCPEADGYIFIATRPKCTNKPHAHIMVNDDEDTIAEKIQKLGAELNGNNSRASSTSNNPNTIDDIGSNPICNTDSLPSNTSTTNTLQAIVLDINGAEVKLSREEMETLKEVMRFCSENGYKIKEVICG